MRKTNTLMFNAGPRSSGILFLVIIIIIIIIIMYNK